MVVFLLLYLLYTEGQYFLSVTRREKKLTTGKKVHPSHARQWGTFFMVWADDNPRPYHTHCLSIQIRLQQTRDSQKEPMGHENPIAYLHPYTW